MADTDNATKKKILSAAKVVFLEKGFDGARMQEIASKAGINKSMLNYYFRYKENLFEAIFEEEFSKLVPKINIIMNSDKSLSYKISTFVDTYIDLFIENPFIPNFVLNELNKNPEKIVKILEKYDINPHIIMDQLNNEIEINDNNPINLVSLIVNILSLCIFPFIGRPILNAVFFNNDTSKYQDFLNERKKEITALMINSINKRET
jgi:AcrR family transcriptional regulator